MSQKIPEFKNVKKVLRAFMVKVVGEENVKKYCPFEKRNSVKKNNK